MNKAYGSGANRSVQQQQQQESDFSMPASIGVNWSSKSTTQSSVSLPGVNTSSYSETTTGSGTGLQELNQRGYEELRAENSLEGSTSLQRWMRYATTFWMEFWVCMMFYIPALTSVSLGGGILGAGLSIMVAKVGILGFSLRENVGHFDPVVTVMLTIAGETRLPWYWSSAWIIAQICAGILATLFVWAMTPGFDRTLGLGTDTLAFGYTPGQGLCCIIFGSWIIYSSYLWLYKARGVRNYYQQIGDSDKHLQTSHWTIGAAHGAAAFSLGRVTGTRFNFILYIMPALVSNTTDSSNWWIWLVGTVVGGAAALFTFYGTHWFDHYAREHVYKRLSANTPEGDSSHEA